MESVSRAARISGWIISGFIVLFMLVDSGGKILRFAPYIHGTVQLGYPERLVVPIGILALVCTILYVIPQTSVLGAILLAAYYGGATATHVRVGRPFWFPVIFGVLTWLGLWLRDERLRALTPLRKRGLGPDGAH